MQEFRNANGHSTDLPPLQLSLRDFASEPTANDILGTDGYEDVEFFISMEQLCEVLTRAEKDEQDQDDIAAGRTQHTQHVIDATYRRLTKRKLSESSPPETSEVDEKGWQKREERTSKRQDRGDASYSDSDTQTQSGTIMLKNDEEAFQEGHEVHFSRTQTIGNVEDTVYVISGRSFPLPRVSSGISDHIQMVCTVESCSADGKIIIMQDSILKLTKN